MQRLMVKVRGPREALQAVRGGAQIVQAEYPGSILGTTYPLNILAIREKLMGAGYVHALVATSIGEKPLDRALACQAALGAATAGADVVVFGIAELPLKAAVYLGDSVVRTVKKIYPLKKVIPAVFADTDMRRYFEPFEEGIELLRSIRSDGLLLDIYNRFSGRGIMDSCNAGDIARFSDNCHSLEREAWVSGSVGREDLPGLWQAGVDVVGVREAACIRRDDGVPFEIRAEIVRELMATIPGTQG
jgi:(5-formylfuran-3-yl)methyl phosphate synthase